MDLKSAFSGRRFCREKSSTEDPQARSSALTFTERPKHLQPPVKKPRCEIIHNVPTTADVQQPVDVDHVDAGLPAAPDSSFQGTPDHNYSLSHDPDDLKKEILFLQKEFLFTLCS